MMRMFYTIERDDEVMNVDEDSVRAYEAQGWRIIEQWTQEKLDAANEEVEEDEELL